MRKWKAPVLYTAMGVLIGSSFMAATPAMASQNFKTFVANLVQNGQTVSKPSAIAYNGTSYFGIWWLQQQLKKDGIDVQWDGKSLTLTGMPVQSPDTLAVQGAPGQSSSTVFANTIDVNGVTYVPLSEVQALLKAAGSTTEVHSGHDDEQDSDHENSNLQGVVNQLKHINEKLSEFQSGQQHGEGDGEGELFSSFAGSLMQLQSVISQLNQISQSSTGTSTGTTGSTGTTDPTGSTGSTTTGSTTTGSTTTGSTTTGSTSAGTGSTSGTATGTQPVQLSDVVTSLQNDWKALNAYALQTVTASSGSAGTSADLTAVIADINTQIKALSSMTVQTQHGDDESEHHHD